MKETHTWFIQTYCFSMLTVQYALKKKKKKHFSPLFINTKKLSSLKFNLNCSSSVNNYIQQCEKIWVKCCVSTVPMTYNQKLEHLSEMSA